MQNPKFQNFWNSTSTLAIIETVTHFKIQKFKISKSQEFKKLGLLNPGANAKDSFFILAIPFIYYFIRAKRNWSTKKILKLVLLIAGDVPTYTAVQGSSVELPCNITPPIFTDRVRLVLFFRNDSAIPIYT